MELLVLIAFLTAFLLGTWAARRTAEMARVEPWFLITGAVILLMLAWWDSPGDARGPQILLTIGALSALYRAAWIFVRLRCDGDAAPRAGERT